MNIEGHYNISQVIHELKRRQRTKRQVRDMYNKMESDKASEFENQNRDLAEETAKVAASHKFGRVVTSARTR